MSLTQERLKEVLHYDPETGVFTRIRKTSNRHKVGDVAGCVDKARGYVRIQIDGVLWLAHRLAWLYVYGVTPTGQIDHINRTKTDNSIRNLRDTTSTENNQNLGNFCTNTSGKKGVTWCKGKWQAQISANGVHHYLGRYDSVDAAGEAYEKAKVIFHTGMPASDTSVLP